MKFRYTSWERIPTLEIEYIRNINGETCYGYLTPYRGYGFQVCVDLEGSSALGLIYADLKGIYEAAGGYGRVTLAALAYTGLAEWAASMGVEDQLPSSRLFTRAMIIHNLTPAEKVDWSDIQSWLAACQDWIVTKNFTPGGYIPE